MRNPGGYLIATETTGKVSEQSDTFTCFHCQRIVVVKPMCDPADMGGRCRICDGLVCPACHAKGNCDPFEEKLKRYEASYHARRSYGL